YRRRLSDCQAWGLAGMASWLGCCVLSSFFFFFQAEDGIRDDLVTGVQTCALPIFRFTLLGREPRGDRMLAKYELSPNPTFKPTRSEERRVGKECRQRQAPQA